MNSIKSLLTASVVLASVGANAVQFRIDWTNHGPQGQSPLFYSVGNSSFDIFQLGTGASAGIKAIAEGGNVAPMLGIAAAAGSNLQTYGALTGGPLAPGLTRSTFFDASAGNDFFSFASMMGMTNDGFIGESVSSQGLRLFSGSTALGFSVNIFGGRVWDAGTEQNTQNAVDLGFLSGASNLNPADSISSVRVHSTIIPNLGDSWNLMPDWDNNTRVATITVTPVPEPVSMIALLIGCGGLARKRASKK